MRRRSFRASPLFAAPRGLRGLAGRATRGGVAAGTGLALAAGVLGASLLGSLGAARAEPLTVVELFTSQGCSSCPPADALLADLADRPDVLALSMHVDYWDYLGWQDVFAMPAFTRRQIAYGEAAGARSVYTPQIIVQGQARMVGSHRDKVIAAIEAAAAAEPAASLDIDRKGEVLEVRVKPLSDKPAPGVLWFITYHSPEPMLIPKGENAGRQVAYRNVARTWMKLGRWDGRTEAVFAAPAPAGETQEGGVAVILQDGPVGPVIAAAKLER